MRSLGLTNEELERLEWCRSVLDGEQVADCEEEAARIAYRQAHAAIAYEKLLPLLVRLKLQEFETDDG